MRAPLARKRRAYHSPFPFPSPSRSIEKQDEIQYEIRTIWLFLRIVTACNLLARCRKTPWRLLTRGQTRPTINRSRSSFHGVHNGGQRQKFIHRVDGFSMKACIGDDDDPF